MSRTTQGADAVQAAAIGHNSPNQKKAEIDILRRASKQVEDIAILQDGLKEILREGKEIGMSKMGIRKAIKETRMTLEQLQARQEVDDEKKRYIAICKEVGLFVPEDEEEAA